MILSAGPSQADGLGVFSTVDGTTSAVLFVATGSALETCQGHCGRVVVSGGPTRSLRWVVPGDT
jgi:hypothetical protein